MQEPGFRVLPRDCRLLSSETIQKFRSVATAHISDNLHRASGILGLNPYHRPSPLAGRALTVKTRAGDNLMIHKAMTMLQPDDVLVVDGYGDTSNALVGELMKMTAESRGCVGFIINGAIRDVAAYRSSTFPCYAKGVTHRGPYKEGPGEVNVPVAIGGTVINPGDLVVGDEDGLVVLPPDDASRVLELANALHRKEEEIRLAIASRKLDVSWIDAVLKAKGIVS